MADLFTIIKEMMHSAASTVPAGGYDSPPPVQVSQEDLDFLFKKKPPGLVTALNKVRKDPLSTTRGALVDNAVNLLTAFNSMAANVVQNAAIAGGVHVPGALDKPIPDPTSLKEVSPRTGLRLARIGNAATLGLSDAILRNISANIPPGYANPLTKTPGTIANKEQQLMMIGGGLWDTLKADTTPLKATGELLRGVDAEGKPLEPRQFGEKAAMVALGWTPFGALFGNLRKAASRLHPSSESMGLVRSAGEINAAEEALAAERSLYAQKGVVTRRENAAKAAVESGEPNVPLKPVIEIPELEKQFVLHKEGYLDNPDVNLILHDVITSDAYKRLAPRLEAQGVKANKILGEVMRSNGISEATTLALRNIYALPPEASAAEIANAVANITERTASHHGEGLSAWAQTVRHEIEKHLVEVRKTKDPNAIRELRRLQASAAHIKSPMAGVVGQADTISRALSTTQKLWLTAMLSQPKTAARNFFSQGMMFGSELFGNLCSGTIEAFAGIKKGDGRSFNQYYGDLLNNLGAMATPFKKDRKTLLQQVFDAVPYVGDMIENGAAFEAHTNVAADLIGVAKATWKRSHSWKEVGKDTKIIAKDQTVDIARDILSLPNRTQEVYLRKLFFEGRLLSDLESKGIKGGLQTVIDAANDLDVLPHDIRESVVSAYEHAMKQTLAAQPEAHILKNILNVYNKVPFILRAATTPFPRFMMNQYRYITERNPALMFELFNPEFRKALMGGIDDGFAQRNAARVLGRATEGMLLLGGAFAWRTRENAEPKYYEVDTGVVDDDGKMLRENVLNYQPFGSYLFAAELLKAVKEGTDFTDLPLSVNEWSEAVVNVRRLTDVPIFAIPDVARAMASGDRRQIQRAIGSVVGQLGGSFFIPARGLQELYEGAVGSEEVTQADVSYEEWTGPMRANLDILLPKDWRLPARVDPTTGDEVVIKHPLFGQLTGAVLKPTTKFKDLLAGTPRIQLSDLTGSHGNAEADRLVAQLTGGILSLPADKSNKTTLGDVMADITTGMNLTPDAQEYVVREVLFPPVRTAATDLAKKIRPDLFVKESILAKTPKPGRGLATSIIDQVLGGLRGTGEIPQPSPKPQQR